jgi:hypothetical protein
MIHSDTRCVQNLKCNYLSQIKIIKNKNVLSGKSTPDAKVSKSGEKGYLVVSGTIHGIIHTAADAATATTTTAAAATTTTTTSAAAATATTNLSTFLHLTLLLAPSLLHCIKITL